jgi:hypothetical protein
MAYLHEVDAYEKDHVFSQDELVALTPSDIKKWMCVKAYGMPEPGRPGRPSNRVQIVVNRHLEESNLFLHAK